MSSQSVLIFDDDCSFCRRSVARIRARDGGSRLEYLARQAPEREQRFPQLNDARYQGAMQLVLPNGEIRSGEMAIATAFTQLSAWYCRWLGHLIMLPVIRPCAHIVYKWIAKNRHRFRCDDGSCQR